MEIKAEEEFVGNTTALSAKPNAILRQFDSPVPNAVFVDYVPHKWSTSFIRND